MKITATFTSLDRAMRSIAGVDPKARAGAKRGVTRANKVALSATKAALTRSRTGLLAKSLGDKVKVSGSIVYGVVGPRLGFRTTLSSVIAKTRGNIFVGFRGRKGGDRPTKAIKIRAAGGLGVGDVIDPAKYSKFIEFGHQRGRGTSQSPAYPFIRPARDRVAHQVPAIIAAAIGEAVHGG